MNIPDSFSASVEARLQAELMKLRALSSAEIEALPEANSEQVVIDGCECALSVFVQCRSKTESLVTIQISTRGRLGLSSRHWEHGLVLGQDGSRRAATSEELLTSGG